jgi:hypothetical protein
MGIRLVMFRPDGSFSGLPNNRAQQASFAPLQYDMVFSNPKNKKYNDISFPYCRMHVIAAGLLQRDSLLRPRPSRLDVERVLRLAAVERPSHATRSRPSHSPTLRRSLPPVARTACPPEPSPVLLTMVVVVLARRRL